MLKKLLLALGLSLISSAAWATCGAIPLTVKDASNATQSISSATAADGNCKTYIDADTSSQLHTDLTAPIPAGTNRIGYASDDPCTQKVKANVPVSTISGNTQLVAPSGSTKVYICSGKVVAGTAAILNLIEGTGAACTTANEAAIWGSTTAASGESYSANGGFAYGNGGATVGVTATAGNGICLLQSGTAQLSGNITYVQQ